MAEDRLLLRISWNPILSPRQQGERLLLPKNGNEMGGIYEVGVHVHGLKEDEIGRATGLEGRNDISTTYFAAMATRGKVLRNTEKSSMLPRRVTTTHI